MTEDPSRDGPKQHLHGRRQGRRLRKGQQSLVETLLPRLRLTVPAATRLDPPALFEATPREVWLEIGFGGGEHLAWQAARHPDVGFLGAEFFINGIASLLSRIEARRLGNIRIHQGDGRTLLAALPDAAIGRAFVLFPDPWRKARHHKRRLIQAETLDALARVLRDGAELRLASDHPGYLSWMLERATGHPAFAWTARGPGDWRRRPDDWPATRYEEKALSAGRRSAFLRFLRRPRGAT